MIDVGYVLIIQFYSALTKIRTVDGFQLEFDDIVFNKTPDDLNVAKAKEVLENGLPEYQKLKQLEQEMVELCIPIEKRLKASKKVLATKRVLQAETIRTRDGSSCASRL